MGVEATETPQQPLNLADIALWRAAVGGDSDAVRTLLDSHMPTVYGFIMARVSNQGVAEDLVQETLTEAVKSSASYRGEASLATWMCSIARRRIARHWERERRQELATSGLRVLPAEQDLMDESLRRSEVTSALRALSAVHRQVLVLKYLDGLSVVEISAEIGRPRVQVQSLLQRARDAFRKEIRRGEDGEDG